MTDNKILCTGQKPIKRTIYLWKNVDIVNMKIDTNTLSSNWIWDIGDKPEHDPLNNNNYIYIFRNIKTPNYVLFLLCVCLIYQSWMFVLLMLLKYYWKWVKPITPIALLQIIDYDKVTSKKLEVTDLFVYSK
jgi:hypothetical protein